jgi:hypothetical protein
MNGDLQGMDTHSRNLLQEIFLELILRFEGRPQKSQDKIVLYAFKQVSYHIKDRCAVSRKRMSDMK